MKKLLIIFCFSLSVFAQPQYCGDEGTVYSAVDFNKDCIVNTADLAVYASMWVGGEDYVSSYITSIEQLRAASSLSNRHFFMKPGVYTVTEPLADNQTVFNFTGSNSSFELSGVTIQIDTQVLADFTSDQAHELAAYRINGDDLTFKGGKFANIGNQPPQRSLPEFKVSGHNVTFKNCEFIIRGSAPYGYGDLYGKGSGSYVYLQKHSAMSITGDNCLVENCDFDIKTFGHCISVHGSQDTTIRGCNIVGDLRLTDEIYDETEGLAFEYDFKIMYPDWRQGDPIPLDHMLSLTEDGIRAYNEGTNKDGITRRTGHITVDNCYVEKMRGGITVTMASSATVTDSVVVDSGYTGHAYSLPSDSTVRNSSGNAAYSPLISMPYSNRNNADIELELLPSDYGMGAHPLARLTGRTYNRLQINYPCGAAVGEFRPIIVGSVGDRYTEENSTPEELEINHRAQGYELRNFTPHPVELTQYSSDCDVVSISAVTDEGTGNTFEIIACGE